MFFRIDKRQGHIAWICLIFTAAPVMAQTDADPPSPTPSGKKYSWLRFSDEFEEPRVAQQPERAEESATGEEVTDDAVDVPAPTEQPSNSAPCACGAVCCDAKKCKALKAAVKGAMKPLFYDNDFSYVNDPCYNDWCLGDHFKRMCLCDHLLVDVGGQYRVRYQSEQNMRGLGLTGRDDDFLLQRTRLYTNVEVSENLRFYAEFLDGVSDFENFAPRPIEENRADVLNLFIDGTLWQSGAEKLRGRVGRQELLYGSQRLVSPLDWSNTRRTFDGGKLMWQNSDWSVDSFWSHPVFPNANSGDNSDLDQQFYGVYSTYRGYSDEIIDFYWLGYDVDTAPFQYQTLGTRQFGTYGDWLTDLEGGYQFGDNADGSSHSAGFVTLGLGRQMAGNWSPKLWVYYDWASGADDLAAGNGFNHLFPLGHQYLGFMDFFGRSNIQTPNVQFSVAPSERLTLLLWYYYFFLQNKNDGPYTVAMTPFANVAPGSADLGHEIDATALYAINPRTTLLLGYSHFFSGKYYDTPGLPYSGDADFLYAQLLIGF